MEQTTEVRRFAPQIDTLRAPAIVVVLMSHLLVQQSYAGHLAVGLFFVISGFLITANLLRDKKLIEAGVPLKRALWVFYLRRALRIFPPYYLMLAASRVVNGPWSGMRWDVAFLSNMLLALENDWGCWFLSHLWTLSIQEQFYLIWPLMILLLAPGVRICVILAMIAAGPLLCYLMPGSPDDLMHLALPPVAFVALGAGGLIAIVEAQYGFSQPVPKILGVGALAGMCLRWVLPVNVFWADVLRESVLVPALAWVLVMCRIGVAGPVGRVLENVWLRCLGRISFGGYLWHLPIMGTVYMLVRMGALPPVSCLVASVLAVGMASLSWFLLEAPLRRLRRRIRLISPADEVAAHRAVDARDMAGSGRA